MKESRPQRRLGQFDKSFVIRILRDYFISLLVLMLLMLGLSFMLLLQEYREEGDDKARYAAERLAEDVRKIMLNKGGPVASRALYPILRRNHERLGLAIAIEPSALTVDSIEKRFDYTPRGLPPEWPQQGRYQSHRVVLKAQPFCLQCHTESGVGDVLGEIRVRNYLDSYIEDWWQDSRASLVVGLVDIVVGSLVVFVLLRARMEPLLALRSMVGRIARGELRLSDRAEVKSSDEFGELAYDLNMTLERICEVLMDMERLFSREIHTDEDVDALVKDSRRQLGALRGRFHQLLAASFPDESESSGDVPSLEARLARLQQWPGQAEDLGEILEAVSRIMRRHERLGRDLAGTLKDVDDLETSLSQLGHLSERLSELADAERRLLERLS